MLTSLVILGCGQRKNQTSRLVPAIDRYDGPMFRVLRMYTREVPENRAQACVLSGRFGLIPGTLPIPRYNRPLTRNRHAALREQVETQFKQTLDEIQPERMFVSVGRQYWPLIEELLAREVAADQLVVATGSIGGRASQLTHWLREGKAAESASGSERGEAVLLGTTIRLTRKEVLLQARRALAADPVAARRFETWYVSLGRERVAPKWLVSILFRKPVARFRTADARRILSLLGVDCTYASR